MSSLDITLLMTGVGGPGANGYIYSLQNNPERKIRIIGTDISERIDPETMAQLAAFYTIPRAGTIDYLPRLLGLCKDEHVDVILPLNTAELSCLSFHRADFEALGTKVCVLDSGLLETVNNKGRLLQHLQAIGIVVPEFAVVHSVPEFQSALQELGYPRKAVVVKRPDGNGSRGIRFLDASVSMADVFLKQKPRSLYISLPELLSILPEIFVQTPLVVMEHLPGQEYSVDTLVQNGQVIRSVCRRVDLSEDSNDVDATVEQVPDVLSYCDRISEQLNIDGLIGYGVMRNAAGEPRLLEINPRLQSTTILSVMAGVNFPYAVVKKALNEPITLPEPREGIRTVQRKQKLFFSQAGELLLKI